MRSQFRVQCVDTFQNQYHIIIYLQIVSFELTLTGGEIKTGQFDLLSTKQSLQLLIKKLQVQGIEGFIVIVAALIFRGIFSIYEIVIQRNRIRSQAIGHKLDAESFAECRFS